MFASITCPRALRSRLLTNALVAMLAAPLGGCVARAFPPLPSVEPLRFQQRLTGKIVGRPRLVRWTLRLQGSSATLDAAARLVESSGEERTSQLHYTGRYNRDLRGLHLSLSAEQRDIDFPTELSLSCQRTLLSVLPAGADLVPGDACGNGGPLPHWQPAAVRDVAAWLCEIDGERVGPWIGFDQHGPLAFAAGAGVEWIYINHDCAGQEGAYRVPSP